MSKGKGIKKGMKLEMGKRMPHPPELEDRVISSLWKAGQYKDSVHWQTLHFEIKKGRSKTKPFCNAELPLEKAV